MKLEVRNLHCRFEGRLVLQDVSFSFDTPHIIAIVGPNGSGKTTLLRSIYRSLKPEKGEILLDGRSVWGEKHDWLARRIAVVLQSPGEVPHFTVKQVVSMGRLPHRSRQRNSSEESHEEIIQNSLRILGLEDFAQRKFSSLSGGEKQWVLLARALAQEPKILVMDEPTNHLDVTHQLKLMKTLKDLKFPILMAIHDLNLAVRFANQLIVLKDGCLLGQGNVEEVIKNEILSKAFDMKVRMAGADVQSERQILVEPH